MSRNKLEGEYKAAARRAATASLGLKIKAGLDAIKQGNFVEIEETDDRDSRLHLFDQALRVGSEPQNLHFCSSH